MSIVSTNITQDGHTQADGRRNVVEVHTFSDGAVLRVVYRAEVGADSSVIATARVPALEQLMADIEAEGLLNG